MERILVISSDLENLGKVRIFLEKVFAESNFDFSHFNYVYLGLSEALTNSIIHGNKNNPCKQVRIVVNCTHNEIFIEIADEGEGFFHELIKDPTSLENIRNENGRGIFLMRHYAEQVDYFDGGRTVKIKYNLG